MSKRLKNSKMKYFDNCEHEIFIEKDNHRKNSGMSLIVLLKNKSLSFNYHSPTCRKFKNRIS